MWQFPPAFEPLVPADGGVTEELMAFETFNTEVKLFDSQADMFRQLPKMNFAR